MLIRSVWRPVLHDLGKIGMSNTLLYNPGSFDDRERANEFRRHPALGADLVQSFHLFSPRA
jgi:HD-GYP domain-containing protein (c-di-GMP phosphodiesterase class II)